MRAFIENYGYFIVLFPAFGAALNGMFGSALQRRYGEKPVGVIANASVFLSFLMALAAFVAVRESDGDKILSETYRWLDVGLLKVDVTFLFDPLSSVMILVVTGVGFLIHVYSMGYMKGDPGYYRFFAYLNLFIFSMLLLVLGENLLVMFIGWEGVGLCSYLLISFWYKEKENAIAGNKAFIVNRVGDFGFLLGIFLIYYVVVNNAPALGPDVSVLSFGFLEQNAALFGSTEVFFISAATAISLLLFVGATGKSAQIPLYVWLPDAMAGPTPVSALIHAATMVTAGVYMIGRMHFLFSLSPVALSVVAYTGAFTALFAATIACAQTDIKKILAYSTISQLGYMFLAMGVAAYPAGIFHLVTHAFFKAGLFLGAGSVILGVHHEQDIRWMGGIRGRMPLTFATFAVSALAISGIPPLSGFFSKDEILWKAWSGGSPVLWFMGFAAAGLTAFYMTRLVVMTFYGENRAGMKPARARGGHAGHGEQHEVTESPRVITYPLVALAFLAVVAGVMGVPKALGGSNMFEHFLGPVFGAGAGGAGGAEGAAHGGAIEYLLMAASVMVAALGIAAGWFLYDAKRRDLLGRLVKKINIFYVMVYYKYFVDELYDFVFVSGTKTLSVAASIFDKYVIDMVVNMMAYVLRLKAYLSGLFDMRIIDGAANFMADTTLRAGSGARRLQTGKVQAYVLILFVLVAFGISLKFIL